MFDCVPKPRSTLGWGDEIAEAVRLAVQSVGLLDGDAGPGREQLDLLGRPLGQRGGAAEGVKVVLEERLLLSLQGHPCGGSPLTPGGGRGLDPLDVTGDELELGVGVAAPLSFRRLTQRRGRPRRRRGRRRGCNRPARSVVGLIRDADVVLARGVGGDLPDERRPGDQTRGSFGSRDLGKVGPRAGRAATRGRGPRAPWSTMRRPGGEQGRHHLGRSLGADRPRFADRGTSRGPCSSFHEVELVILLQDGRRGGGGHRPERDSRRVDPRRLR